MTALWELIGDERSDELRIMFNFHNQTSDLFL